MAKSKKVAKQAEPDGLVHGTAVRSFTWQGVGIARNAKVAMDAETFGVHERVGLVQRGEVPAVIEPDEADEVDAAE
jgi:hypothetical protein